MRHDGYLQLREAVMTKDEGSDVYKKRIQHLDGLVPATDLNLENAFHDRDKDEVRAFHDIPFVYNMRR